MREPVVITVEVPFDEVDESFDWWMRQYEREPDGQFLFFAQALQPHATTTMYQRWRREFEHPKGVTVVTMIEGRDHGDHAEHCAKHNRPKAPGYCE